VLYIAPHNRDTDKYGVYRRTKLLYTGTLAECINFRRNY
jgi:hypothetical protein